MLGPFGRTQVAEKMALLDEFEDRFNRQYKCEPSCASFVGWKEWGGCHSPSCCPATHEVHAIPG